MMRAQVAVVGGGPVGLLIAAELAGYGVDTVVLEERRRISGRPKATTLHARAVQCLARRGHLPGPVLPVPAGPRTADFHFAGLPGLVVTAPGTEPGPILKVSQAELERAFETRARGLGVRVLREHRVTEVVPHADGVGITAGGPAGPVAVSAAYLVGADGARSTVRELAGIASDTYPATVSALMGRVRLADGDEMPPGWHRTPRGWIVVKRDPDGGTHIRTLDCAHPHSDRHLPPSLEELSREVARIAGRDIAMSEPRWLSRFSDFTRVARTFRAGRVLLAGDAAHVHFPIGGQGLSTGVLDALNLGWKLALTVRGLAAPGLLDTYHQERQPAAQRVVDVTRAQLALMRQVPETDALRPLLGGLLAADRATGYLQGLVSAQDTVYPACTPRPSAGEGTFLRNAALSTGGGGGAGEEAGAGMIELLRDGRPLLLLFGEKGERWADEAREWASVVRTVRARPTPEVPYEALLVRPDGYIAWAPGAGRLAEALAVHFTRDAPAPECGRRAGAVRGAGLPA
jgi:2-polyprenyl-6-methoxyphenol hydroxylase-like FAD-dependent oxidoreductase